MEVYQQGKPQLDVAEAVVTALGRLTDFKGRSRRSEFWWWMLIVMLVNYLSGFLTSGNLLLTAVIGIVIMAFGLAVTVRRLHDVGQSGLWVVVSYLLGIAVQIYVSLGSMKEVLAELGELGKNIQPEDMENLLADNSTTIYVYFGLQAAWALSSIIVIIMCLLDSKPLPNKYGESPKYGRSQL